MNDSWSGDTCFLVSTEICMTWDSFCGLLTACLLFAFWHEGRAHQHISLPCEHLCPPGWLGTVLTCVAGQVPEWYIQLTVLSLSLAFLRKSLKTLHGIMFWILVNLSVESLQEVDSSNMKRWFYSFFLIGSQLTSVLFLSHIIEKIVEVFASLIMIVVVNLCCNFPNSILRS